MKEKKTKTPAADKKPPVKKTAAKPDAKLKEKKAPRAKKSVPKAVPPASGEAAVPAAPPAPVPLQEAPKKRVRKPPKPKAAAPAAPPAVPAPPAKAAVPPPAPVPSAPPASAPPAAVRPPQEAKPKPKISINETITVKDLAEKMNLKVGDILMRLLKLGVRASLNQRLDIDHAILLAGEFGFDAVFSPIYSEEAMVRSDQDDQASQRPRSPIVTIMGHVDHGKTSLLDAIRETSVAEKEAGGITQHIGAYKVRMDKGSIVFLDTPGHEAFTAMRARGAQVTDVVVLVVAADDGVMPQTVEAIDHAKAAGVPILVAVNKIDLPQAKSDRVKQELSQYGLTPEEWGGKTIFIEVSAKKRINIDKLLEMILLEAELLELKANPNRPAQGVVIEARLDPKRGPVSTVIVQKGTIRVGNTFVCGLTSGKVKALADDRGHRLQEAGPSTPVEVLGFSNTPQLGERVIVVDSEREAREISERRKDLSREARTEKRRHVSLEMLSAAAKQGRVKVLRLILKVDVQGSLEALKDSIEKMPTAEIRVEAIHSGVGGINESDVSLAAASDAVIIGFNVRPEPAAEELARREGVEIKTYRIIYEVTADIRAAMEGLLEPEEKETVLGRVEVREVFKTPAGKVAGCMVVRGKIQRTAKARLLRDSKIVFEGPIASLRRFKEDAREVAEGYDCGVALENFQDFQKGDVFEVFIKEKQSRKLA
ncbi:MAG: translation initiation factor IF-2 [Elusimicrobia bacterium RIFCSPLOWO2_01_FULL_64_13]|nr:MAG: translation initiation factor IF-2 [Elusimicrobia bacterium RIFCSPHIGHO2_01_FULL_64_10]OGR97565.1 MAG: translation initiation factor IF-2 [Elusimicrobia bacterium RIFCSPLOWO2_01_FULL_64_13]